METFNFYRTPKIVFGAGSIQKLGTIAASFGKKVLLVTGASSFKSSPFLSKITASLSAAKISWNTFEISGEPSPSMIDTAVSMYRQSGIDCVVAIGGGSAVDAGKAISAMLPLDKPVSEYLEVVGKQGHPGCKVPFIAVPTTAGTGSEASANAVLSEIGHEGFKRSIRHENLCPDVALVDPQLSITCPPDITAACGMDALTQLLESYVSDKTSPFTDALIESAIPKIGVSLIAVCTTSPADIDKRSILAYGSLVSGITLANAGLGVVHGFASSVGGFFPVPHGIVCGTLLYECTKATIKKLERIDQQHNALRKYAKFGSILDNKELPMQKSYETLLSKLDNWTQSLQIPRLSSFGVTKSDIDRIVSQTGNKNNPIALTNNELAEVLDARI